MREMPIWYALADVALLGGSFEPLGGQNLIEAAACGCPVVMGPHTFNFADAAELALAAGAAIRVATLEEGVVRRAGAGGAGRRAPAARRRRPGVRGGASRRGRAHGEAILRRLPDA
jgi:3-deoxy-D-manno-octulosonic-acid transferase